MEHYRNHGVLEGRQASPAATREGFLDSVLYQSDQDLLEIGPFCQPIVRGSHVSYLDMLDSDALRTRAVAIGLDPHNCPEKIDSVGSIEQVDRTFSAVLSSHSIEHQPDLVRHLQAVGRLLTDQGAYFLIIPDKRFCMDADIAPSTIAG